MHYQQTILWNKAMATATMAIEFTGPLQAANEFPLSQQIRKSSFDVARFVAEGWTRESRYDKAHYMAAAQGSLAELVTQVLICERCGWVDPADSTALHSTMEEVSRMLTSLRRRLRADLSLPVSESVLGREADDQRNAPVSDLLH